MDPRDGWPNPAATAMASGAGRVLDHALVASDLPGALEDCDYVLATTARMRGLTKQVFNINKTREQRDRQNGKAELDQVKQQSLHRVQCGQRLHQPVKCVLA